METNFSLAPLHQIKVGDTIAYYPWELTEQREGYRDGQYTATVVEKVPYTLRLTTGLLKPVGRYRVVSRVEAQEARDQWALASRAKAKTVSHNGRRIPID